MNILLIEDEPNMISLIKRALDAEGYSTSVAMDGNTGLKMAVENSFDVIILDLMLPGINGLDVCRQLREKDRQTPLLMLSALGTTENVVTGLDSGADDYLAKPFKLAELQARIRTLVRRTSIKGDKAVTNALVFSDIVLNKDAKTVEKNGKLVTLTATEFRLLEHLMINQNKVLSRMDLLENVWGVNFNLGTNVVDVYINYLRKKVDTNPDKRLIHTVFGMGYVMRME